MKDMGFNIKAFIAPTTPAEYIALLDEALRMAGELNGMLDRDWKLLGQHAQHA